MPGFWHPLVDLGHYCIIYVCLLLPKYRVVLWIIKNLLFLPMDLIILHYSGQGFEVATDNYPAIL